MKRRKWIIFPTAVLLLAAVFLIYASIYYHAESAADAFLYSYRDVTVTQTDYGWVFDGPSEEEALVFYPGAKVDEKAYAPFLHLLSEKGIDVFLVKMPFHLAFFGISKADDIISANTYDRWFIGGHSLGGAMAAVYAAKHEELSGVILCAAYPTKPLDKEDLEITIYGSEDQVLNRNSLEKGRQYASDHAEEYEIPGGNHAQFGLYGKQSGDGEAKITPAEQWELAVEFILEKIKE